MFFCVIRLVVRTRLGQMTGLWRRLRRGIWPGRRGIVGRCAPGMIERIAGAGMVSWIGVARGRVSRDLAVLVGAGLVRADLVARVDRVRVALVGADLA